MERLAQAELIGVGRRLRATAPIAIAPKTAELQVRIRATAKSHVAIVVDLDGELYRCEAEFEAGPYRDRAGNVSDWTVLGYGLPHGHFDNTPKSREEWAEMPMRRLGELAKSSYRAWVEVTGSAEVELLGEVQDAPRGWHSSVAYQNAGSGYANATQSVSFSFTAGAGSDRAAFLFGANSRDTRPTSSTLTFGGSAPSVALGEALNTYWRGRGAIVKDSEIDTGAKTVAFSTSGGGGTTYFSAVMAVSFTGVDQTTPNGTPGTAGADSGTALSITVASPASDSMIVDGWAWAQSVSTNPTIGANQTSRVNGSQTNGGQRYVASTQLGSDGGVMSWTKASSGFEYVGMAVEKRASRAVQTRWTTAETTHAVTLPSIASGDYVTLEINFRDDLTVTDPTGWTLLGERVSGGVGDLRIYGRLCDGSEGSSVDVVTNSTTVGIGIARNHGQGLGSYAIQMADSGGTPGSQPDPPSLTQDAAVWLIVGGWAAEAQVPQTFPANYERGSVGLVSAGGASVGLMSAIRLSSQSSQDPGAFGASASPRWWTAATVALYEGGGPTPVDTSGQSQAAINSEAEASKTVARSEESQAALDSAGGTATQRETSAQSRAAIHSSSSVEKVAQVESESALALASENTVGAPTYATAGESQAALSSEGAAATERSVSAESQAAIQSRSVVVVPVLTSGASALALSSSSQVSKAVSRESESQVGIDASGAAATERTTAGQSAAALDSLSQVGEPQFGTSGQSQMAIDSASAASAERSTQGQSAAAITSRSVVAKVITVEGESAAALDASSAASTQRDVSNETAAAIDSQSDVSRPVPGVFGESQLAIDSEGDTSTVRIVWSWSAAATDGSGAVDTERVTSGAGATAIASRSVVSAVRTTAGESAVALRSRSVATPLTPPTPVRLPHCYAQWW